MINIKNSVVDIHLDSGLYVYENLSATGKTYLPNVMRFCGNVPPVKTYSTKSEYDNFLRMDEVKTFTEDGFYFFDRFDLFGSSEILHSVKSAPGCILFDCKRIGIILAADIQPGIAVLERTEKGGFRLRGLHVW